MPSGAVVCELELAEAIEHFHPAECAQQLREHPDPVAQQLAGRVALLGVPVERRVDMVGKTAWLRYQSEDQECQEVHVREGMSVSYSLVDGSVTKVEWFME
eukprot:TRINITY_DN23307_c0_g1_i1.p1 TRINITY_DN23307_c0_g1~~TRINITY_DN23307_c0_g1_i1.p1  ORF type:complete len:101 (+),score=29.84 TRINITY_DN23307_c0_g1_i1:39-341(+)